MPTIHKVVSDYVLAPHNIAYTLDLKGEPNPTVLEEQQPMLNAIFDQCHPNGALEQSATKSALKQHADEKEQVWHLSTEADDWADKTAKKIRAMCRHYGQSKMKVALKLKKTPAAVKLKKAPEAAAGGQTPEEGEQKPEAAFQFGYDGHLQSMWRRDKDKKKAKKEHCIKYTVPAEASTESKATAVWADGTSMTCWETTCGKALERGATRLEGKRTGPEAWWSGESKSGVSLQLRRVTRGEQEWAQLWMPNEAKQVSQCTLTTPPMITFLIEQSKRYASGEISKVEFEVAKKTKVAQEKERVNKEAKAAEKAKGATGVLKEKGATESTQKGTSAPSDPADVKATNGGHDDEDEESEEGIPARQPRPEDLEAEEEAEKDEGEKPKKATVKKQKFANKVAAATKVAKKPAAEVPAEKPIVATKVAKKRPVEATPIDKTDMKKVIASKKPRFTEGLSDLPASMLFM